jgi:hypothetical protein
MSEGAVQTGGDAAAPASTPPAQSAPPASASAIPSAFDWKSVGLSKETADFVAAKGWKDPSVVVGSYQNLEKTLGNSVRIPGEDAKPEDVAKFWSKVGRPEKAEEYKAPEGYKVPDGGVDLVPWFQQIAHKHNLPAKAFEGVVGEFTSHMQELASQEQEAFDAQVNQQAEAVTKAWGSEAPVHARNIQQFRQAFGLTTEQTTNMMLAIGPEAWAKFSSRAGSYFAEAKIGADLPGGGSQFGMTVEAAQARLSELTSDSNFAARYANEDRTAVNEVARLHKIIAGRS